jgi:hypothetical protein
MATAQIKHVGFTLPSPMEREFHQIATEEHRTKSEQKVSEHIVICSDDTGQKFDA